MMDRDVVNVLHCLYWGVPIRRSDLEVQRCPYVWSPDTIDDIDRLAMVTRDGDNYRLVDGCASMLKSMDEPLSRLPTQNHFLSIPIMEKPRRRGTRRPAFLATPYAQDFKAVTRTVVAAAKAAGFNCDVTGDNAGPGNLMEQVWKGIRRAEVVVADITGCNPNVMVEIGFALSLGKPLVLISQSNDLPFDIRSHRREIYSPDDLATLRGRLEQAFAEVEIRYPMDDPDWRERQAG